MERGWSSLNLNESARGRRIRRRELAILRRERLGNPLALGAGQNGLAFAVFEGGADALLEECLDDGSLGFLGDRGAAAAAAGGLHGEVERG